MEADLEFLMRVALKIETIREDLGKVGTVIAEQVEEAMLGRRTTLNTEKAEKEAEPIRKMLKFERDLQKQVQALMEQYRETQRELRLSPENIRQVVEVGLSLAGQPALIPDQDRRRQAVFPVAAAQGKLGGLCGRSGASAHEGHLAPSPSMSRYPGGETTWCWCISTTVCPRCACGCCGRKSGRKRVGRNFSGSRLVSCPNDVLDTPAVVAHARLVVIGGDSYRLHEEIIAAGGFIKDATLGKPPQRRPDRNRRWRERRRKNLRQR